MTISKFPICVAVLALAGCGASAPPAANTLLPKSPHDVQATAPGQASCHATTAGENAAAAAATNGTRRTRGLAPVSANADLAEVAARHACDMARRGLMSHHGSSTTGPMQRLKAHGYRPSLAAENIAAGPYGQERVLHEWARSEGHLANILLPQLRHYGIGRAVGSDGRTVFWAAVYGAPR